MKILLYIPVPSFVASASLLHDKHLQHNVSTSLRILATLQQIEDWQLPTTPDHLSSGQAYPRGEYDHPCIRMWLTYRGAVYRLGLVCAMELQIRTQNHNIIDLFYTEEVKTIINNHTYEEPWWLRLDAVTASHRAALKADMPRWYEAYQWPEPSTMPLFWPCGQSITPTPYKNAR